jgi:hypothetical protein
LWHLAHILPFYGTFLSPEQQKTSFSSGLQRLCQPLFFINLINRFGLLRKKTIKARRIQCSKRNTVRPEMGEEKLKEFEDYGKNSEQKK